MVLNKINVNTFFYLLITLAHIHQYKLQVQVKLYTLVQDVRNYQFSQQVSPHQN